jgi:hypothetical protein
MMKSQFIVARIYSKERLVQGILQPDNPSMANGSLLYTEFGDCTNSVSMSVT